MEVKGQLEVRNVELNKEKMMKEELKLDLEKKQVNIEKNFMEFSKTKQIELENLNYQLNQKQDFVNWNNVVSESEKRE